MNLTISTYNGSTVSTYGARIPGELIASDANPISGARVSDAPAYGGKSFKPEEFDLLFPNLSNVDATRNAQVEALGGIFNTRDTDLHALVGLDVEGGTVAYYINATPVKFHKEGGLSAKIRMWSADPVWQKVAATYGTISNAGTTGAEGTITNNGNVDAYPVITVTPTADAGYQLYRNHCVIYNPTNKALANYAVNIAGTAWNSAAEISAGRLQIDGDDVAVKVNGTPVERWLGNINTAAGKVWITLDFAPRIEMTTQFALGASGNTFIQFANTTANVKAVNRLPASGILLLGSECIAYTSKNVAKRRVIIADTGRGIKDTTAATHAIGVTARWIQYDIVLLTGTPSATAPDQTDVRKPCFSLDNSTNTNWRWDSADSSFGDMAGLRPGGWKPSRPKGTYSEWYTGNQGTAGVDPITNLGAEIVSYNYGDTYKSEVAQIDWTFQNNATITQVSAIGEKYKLATGTPWPKARLQSSLDGITWVTEYTLATPSANTWTAWTQANESVPTGTMFLRFRFVGAVNAVVDAVARNEVNLGSSGSTGVTLSSTKVPQVTLMPRASNAEVNFTITNTTTGDSILYSYPLKTDQVMTLDTVNRTISVADRLLAPPELNSVRQEWLRLQPGANVITYSDSYAAGVTIVLAFHERKNA